MLKIRRLLGLLVIIAILAVGSSAKALTSPIESNPIFSALLASLLGSESLSEEQKLQRLEGFFSILQISFDNRTLTPQVHSLQEYLSLRNAIHPSPETAYQAYLRSGIVTPLSVRASSPKVMEAIMSFEAQAAKDFLIASRKQLGPSSGLLNIQAPIWEMLPDLYLGAKGVRDAVDRTSQELIRQSYEKAEELRQKGNPAGILSWFLGTGLSFARATGEHIINPLAESVIHGELIQNPMKQKVLVELRKLQSWPREKKLDLIRDIESSMQSALSGQIQIAARQSEMNRFVQGLPLANVIRDRVLPEYFANLSSEQKSAMVWTVFSTPNFNQMKESQQIQIVMRSLGPLFPYWLRQLSRLPELKGHELSKILCCQENKTLQAFEVEALQQKFLQASRLSNVQSVKVDPRPLTTSPLKDTYLVTVKDKDGERKVVFQRVRPELAKLLKLDLETLAKLQAQTELMNQLAEAGAPQSREMISALMEGVQEETDLKRTSERQNQARQVYQHTIKRKLGLRSVEIKIDVAKTLESGSTSEVLLQEFAPGLSIAEARVKYPSQVNAALESFAEIYLKTALANDKGFVWSEPREENMRIEIDGAGEKIKLTLMNFGSSHDLTRNELQNFYSALGKISLQDLLKLDAGNLQIQDSLKLVEQTIEAGLPIHAKTLRFAQGFLHLRGLVGPDQFRQLLIKTSLKQPSILWSVLGPRLKGRLQEIYDNCKQRLMAMIPRSSKPVPFLSEKGPSFRKALCPGVHSR